MSADTRGALASRWRVRSTPRRQSQFGLRATQTRQPSCTLALDEQPERVVHDPGDVIVTGKDFGPNHQRVVELERYTHRASLPGRRLLPVAEGEGFEPSRRCYRLRDFQSRALGQAMRPFRVGYRLSVIVLTDSPTCRLRPPGGEGGIRTHGGSSPHRFSRAAPSTTRTPLQPVKYTNAVPRDGAKTAAGTARPPGDHRAASRGYAWQDSNLRPLGPQPNALSPELQARIAYFTPEGLRPAVTGRLGREGRDSNPRSAFSALNRLAGGPIRPLWHLPRWLCPRLANGVACTGFQTRKFTTRPGPSRYSVARQAGERPHHEPGPPLPWPCHAGAHCPPAVANTGGTRSRDACS